MYALQSFKAPCVSEGIGNGLQDIWWLGESLGIVTCTHLFICTCLTEHSFLFSKKKKHLAYAHSNIIVSTCIYKELYASPLHITLTAGYERKMLDRPDFAW